MTISGLQVQHILRTHHRSIRWGETGVEEPINRPVRHGDVEISTEGRKNQIRQNATNRVLERLTRAGNGPVSSREETR